METSLEALRPRAADTSELPPVRRIGSRRAKSGTRRPTADMASAPPASRRQTLWARVGRLYRRRQRSLFVFVVLLELTYVFVSVPLRFGFLFDPYAYGDWRSEWTRELTVLTALDLLADLAGVANFYEIFAAQRRAQAASAAGASMPVGSRHNGIGAPRGPTASTSPARVRRGSLLMQGKKSSLLVAWSLNTLAPAMKLRRSIRRPIVLEAIAMAPIEVLSIALGPNSLHVLRALKLLRLHRAAECMRELRSLHAHSRLFQHLEFTGNALLAKTVASGIALCHVTACIYMAIAHFECGIDLLQCTKALVAGSISTSTSSGHRRLSAAAPTTSSSVAGHAASMANYTCWAIEDQLVGTSLTRQYARSLYWSSRTVITLAFYDATPVTDIETLYVIVVLVLGAVFSTSVLATFLFIFRYRNSRLQEFMAHVDSANAFMKAHSFPADVREGVLSFYKNAWATHQGMYHGEVIERLPEHLSVSVYSVLKVQRLQNVVFLAKESIEFINTLARDVELCVFSPKDWIIDKAADGMYFVLRGTVLLDSERSRAGQAPRFAKAGDHFAEACLLHPGRSAEDERARAQTFCELYKLPHRSFFGTLSVFYRKAAPAHLERMRSMLTRRDQQEQKMKRMLGRSQKHFLASTASMVSLREPPGAWAASSDSDGVVGSNRAVQWLRRCWRRYHRRQHQRQQLPWIMPGSSFRHLWEHCRFFMLLFVAFEVPLFLVFDSTSFPFGDRAVVSLQSISSVFVELFFMADFVLRARYFAYIDQLAMIPVTDASYIWSAYRESGMWLDLVAVVPVALATEFAITGPLTYLSAFRIARVLRLRHLPQAVQDFTHARGMSSKAHDALSLFLYVTLAIHISGCVWFLMARLNMHPDDFTAIALDHDDHSSVGLVGVLTRDQCLRDSGLYGNCSWAVFDAYGQIGTAFPTEDPTSMYTGKFAYLRAIYWSIVGLTTIGYGDIVAFATSESFFAAIWAFAGGIINYGVVGAMSNIISSLTASSHHHLEKMNNINLVLAHFGVSERVCVQIRRFYHQQLYVQKVSSEARLLEHLPAQLRHRISLELHSESMRKVPLFVELEREHSRLLHSLTGLFRRRIYQRGDAFFPDSSVCDEMVVVVRGRANVFSKRAGPVPVGALTDGSCYGVCELILRKPSATSVVAATIVDVSAITYSAFSAIERRFPAEVQLLRLRALQQLSADELALEAIVGNMKARPTVAKFTDKCASMFVDKDDWANHVRKTQLRLYWDLLLLLVDMYNAVQITFRICFLHRPDTLAWLVLVLLDFATDVLLALDVALKLHYFECDGGLSNLVTREHRDATYAKRALKWDLASCAPLYYVGGNFVAMSVCRLPRLLRLRHVAEVFDSLTVRIQQRFSAGGNISAYLGPLKLALSLIFAAHFAGCVFYLISITEHNEHSWIEHDHIVHQEHGSTGVLYLRSFYWAITTLTLVGSREIVPLGVSGTVWAALTSLCCAFIVGHIVGELSDLILDLDKTGKELKEREDRFDRFAKEHDLPASIRTRALHYLRFQHAYLRGMDIYETFHDLSPNLRVQLMLDLHGDTIRGLCIAPFLSDAQVNALAVRLRSELFIAGDTIVVEGNLGHKLFVVKCGTAMVLWKGTGTAVATLQAGSLFGEVAFFLRGQRRIATVQATTSSEMLVVDRRAWEELLALSRAEEAAATEQALTRWVCDCLKGYNVMTVEIVKSIKLGDAVPPTIQELHTYNSAMRQQSSGRGLAARRLVPQVPLHRSNRDSVGTIQEKQVRHLLRKAEQQKHKAPDGGRVGQQRGPAPSSLWSRALRFLSMGLAWTPGTPAGRQARVYATTSESIDSGVSGLDVGEDEEEKDERTPNESGGGGAGSVKQLNGAWTVRSLPQTPDLHGKRAGRYMARALPMLRSGALKHAASTMQINPASTSMREYYGDGQLAEMEAECWRRYKVSLFLAESYMDRQQQAAALADARSIIMAGTGSSVQATDEGGEQPAQTNSDDDESEEAGAGGSVARRPVGRRGGETRKTFCGTMLPSEGPNRSTRNSVANDGTRWLANYETRNRSAGLSVDARRGSIAGDRYRSFSKLKPPHLTGSTTPTKRRVLKRSQSLPVFDRHFANMVHAELQESSAKDHESKLNLGFELLQRCRQPEFSFLFQAYLAWLRKKRAWSQSRVYRLLFDSAAAAVVRPGARSMRDLTSLQSGLQVGHSKGEDKDEGDDAVLSHARAAAAKSAAKTGPGNTSKAEAFLSLLTRYYRLWEGAVVAVAMFYAVTLPFLVCFLYDTDTATPTAALRHWIGAVIFMDLFCITDLVLKYTAFQGVLRLDEGGHGEHGEHREHGEHASNGRRGGSALHHGCFAWLGGLSTHAASEVFAALPLDLIVFLPGMQTLRRHQWYYLSLLQLNKITRIYDSIQASERVAQFLASDLNLAVGDSLVRFVRSLGSYMLAVHWIGCVWFRVSVFAFETYDASWISTQRMLAVDQFESLARVPMARRYVRSLYFSVQSATTTFYGDIASLNVLELVVEIVVILVCIFLFGALVGAQGERIEAKYKRRMLFEQNLTALFHFLKSNDVPRPVRQRLRMYYSNTWLKYHGEDDLDGVDGLSTLLVEDVAQYTMRHFAAKVSILRSCDESFLRSLLTRLKHVICSANEAVVRKGDVDRSMYFIARGKVLVKGLGFELVKQEGDFFGELSLLYGIPRSATCASLGVSLLYVLEWETYELLLADFPEYRQQNRREWVIVSTVLKSGESRFRSIVDIASRMEGADWVVVDDILRKAKRLK